MSMQVSDEELLDDSKMEITNQDSSIERKMQEVESLSVEQRVSSMQNQPEISVEDNNPMSAQQERAPRAEGDQNTVYRLTKDRYVGGIDPVTKLRNGQGTYTYTNPYF